MLLVLFYFYIKRKFMIYGFMKRRPENNPLLKFTKYQRQTLSRLIKLYGVGDPIADYDENYANLCLNDVNKTAIAMTKKSDEPNKAFLSFGNDTEPFAEVTTSGKNGQLCTLVKWLDFFDYMNKINYDEYNDNLPNNDVLTDEERNWYQDYRLKRYLKRGNLNVIGEYYNNSNKPVIYGSDSYTEFKDVYAGLDEKNRLILSLDAEFKKPIIYVLATYNIRQSSIIAGKTTSQFGLGRYLDPVIYKNPNIKPYIRFTEEDKTLLDSIKTTVQTGQLFTKIVNSNIFNYTHTLNGKTYQIYATYSTLSKTDNNKQMLLYFDEAKTKPFAITKIICKDDNNYDLNLLFWIL